MIYQIDDQTRSTESSLNNYYGVDLSSLVNIALYKSASQSSLSRWSKTTDEAKNAVNGIKTGKFGFHTDLEENPWWLVDLEDIYDLEKIIIFNRDDECSTRANNLLISASIDGENWNSIYTAINEFGGFFNKKPLIVNCNSNVSARYVKIQINGKQILHLDEIEVYISKQLLEFKQFFHTFVLNLNKSGFGDQLLDLKISAYILERLGLEFKGFIQESFENSNRVAESSLIYENLGFKDSVYTPIPNQKLISVDLDIQDFTDRRINFNSTLKHIINVAIHQAKGKRQEDCLLSLNLSAALCDRIITDSPHHPYDRTSVVKQLKESFRARQILESNVVNKDSNRLTKVVLHIRLGDTAIVRLPDNKGYIVPFHGLIASSIEEIKTKFAHRYFDLDKLLNFASQLQQKSQINLCVVTDGFARTKQFLLSKRLEELTQLQIEASAIEQIIDREEEKFLESYNFVDSLIYGESDEKFLDSFSTIRDADLIISTGGHFIYNLISTFADAEKYQSLYIRKYGRTSLSLGSTKKIQYIENYVEIENMFQEILEEVKDNSDNNFPVQGQQKPIYLHLGCGDLVHPQFTNIDIRPAPHIHYVREINDLSIFDDNSVELIYASHCLEHFSHREVSRVLKEWNRVLAKGGILRLGVPDFDAIVNMYRHYDNDVNKIMGRLMGGQDYEFNYHKVIFNRKSLENLLLQAGFDLVREWTPGSSDLTSFQDCSRSAVSLNLEAVK